MVQQGKKDIVTDLVRDIRESNGIVLTDYQGLTVAELSDLRAKLRPLKCEYAIVKNTLGAIALKEAGLESMADQMNGPTALAFERGDVVSAAKVIINFSKEHAKLKLKGGLLGANVLSIDQIKALAALPSREVLIAKMMGSMQAPVTGLVNVLQGTIRAVVYALEAVRKSKEQTAA